MDSISIPPLSRPTLQEIVERFPEARIDLMKDDYSLLGACKMLLDDRSIMEAEWEKKELKNLGYQQAVWLVEHQDDSALSALKEQLGKRCYIFLGTSVEIEGQTHVLIMVEHGRRWALEWHVYMFAWSGTIAISYRD